MAVSSKTRLVSGGTARGSVFEFGPKRKSIKKVRETLPPLSYPEMIDYRYGPVWEVEGIRVDGKNISFAEGSMNYLPLTVASSRGCCPYLLVFEPELQEWVSNGKILHAVFGRDREQSETVRISGLKTQFRIEEREPEIAFVRSAQLLLRLNNGEELILGPDQDGLRRDSGTYTRAQFGEAIPISFTVPPGIVRQLHTELLSQA